VALSVAKAFGRYVEQNCPDVKVIYTRKTDVFITLEGRANIANRNKADLFVSIHCNSLPGGKTARGMETYTLGMHRANDNLEVAKRENSVILIENDYKQRYAGFDPRSSESYIMFELLVDKNMEQSVNMARLIQQKTCGNLGRPNKGVKQAGFLVLRETSMPSCLIELGFITTPDEERILNDKNKQDAMGRSIYQAFVAYKGSKGGKVQGNVNIITVDDAKGKNRSEVKEPEQKQSEEKQEDSKPSEKNTSASTTTSDSSSVKKKEEPAPTSQAPVFKVQILTSDVKLKANSPKLKGISDADFYKEGALYKYTTGSSTNYSQIYNLWKQVTKQFPDAFIIAFKNGQKTDVAAAIREYKANKKQ
jgi:N-acetylmuramoyl-L-alanine amidase